MISTMLSGTAGTSLRESRRSPPGRRGPGALIRRGSPRIRTLSSVPRPRPGKARPGTPQDQASAKSRPLRTHPWARPCSRRAAGLPARLPGYRRPGTAPRRRRCDMPVPVRATTASGERLCLVWPSGDSRTTRAPSGCRQLVVLCRPRACTSLDHHRRRMLRPVHRQAVAAPPLTAATAGCAAPPTGLPRPRSAHAVPALQPVPVPGKGNNAMPAQTSPPPGAARPLPSRPPTVPPRARPARPDRTAPYCAPGSAASALP